MSRASAEVRFPDGTIRYGIYDGTSDILQPRLFETTGEAWDCYQDDRRNLWDIPYGHFPDDVAWQIFDVVIYSDYGGGSWWKGKATLLGVESESCNPWENELREGRGYPWDDGRFRHSWCFLRGRVCECKEDNNAMSEGS